MIWTEVADALLVRLWNEGGSLAYVADEMRGAGYGNATRNSIAGRKHRLPPEWFIRPRKPPLHAKARVQRQTAAPPTSIPKVHIPVKEVTPLPMPPEPKGVEWMDNKADRCKAILDKRSGPWNLPMVCGKPRTVDHLGSPSSYCKDHHRIYSQLGPRR